MKKYNLFSILLIKILYFIVNVRSDDAFGCGGFIKSHADIDFSKVEVKLFSKQGSLKDKTDCSPSNGYYFIPIYDKGEYVIKVSPPPGWSFEPEKFDINFNGKTDWCSLGKDINFVFKGFGITGKVGVLGANIGAKGVRIDLNSQDGSDVRHTVTDKSGIFEFTPVVPGRYNLKASHERWSFSKSELVVVVESGNKELPANSLLVSGFDVQGKVTSGGQPFKNVGIALYNAKGQLLQNNCKTESTDETVQTKWNTYDSRPICAMFTSADGEYIFNSISPGKYLIKPYFENKNVKYHISPEVLEIQVAVDGVVLKDNFEITGFDVSGRVLSSQNGKGVPSASIKLNGDVVANSFANGSYVLTNIKPGIFTIQVTADNMEFSDHTVKLSPTNPHIPNIVASAFKVCGQVVSEQSYTVAITRHASTFHTQITTNPNDGSWCTYLANGKYSIEVQTSDAERQNGIQFFPITQEIEVNSATRSGVIFSQLRATVEGNIKCLPDAENLCNEILISMNSLDSGSSNRQNLIAEVIDGKYSFSEVLPGDYDVVILKASHICWAHHTHKITVKSAKEKIPEFVQKGYQISFTMSHKTNMLYKYRNPNEDFKAISLNVGLNEFCVPRSGVYDIKFSGCHTFDEQTPQSFSTKLTTPIIINASTHKNGIRILSEEKSTYNMLVQYRDRNRETTVSFIEEPNKVDGYHAYSHVFDLKSEETIRLLPQSSYMLFKPEVREITGGNDCVDVLFSFIATKGLVINGGIDSKISDVKLTLNFPRNPELESITTMSNQNGQFRFGPIDSNLDYDITAEKESYVFSTFDKDLKLFKANKLCEIIVQVKDEIGNKLPGVLLSLSGGENYRKNSITGDDGTVKFHSLSPNQYYLRPMMKEYKFEPSSKMIEIKDGDTMNVELSGKRVAYSAFGQVTSLNGEPFANVLFEAVSSPENNDNCVDHQEESSSEPNGNFRIRGLQPGCQYDVQIKKSDVNSFVDRSIPTKTSITIENADVKDINVIAISPLNFVDVIAKIYASQNDHYRTLRIQMYKKGSSDSPIYSQRVESPLNLKSKLNPGIMVFFPRIPLDGKTYFIETSTVLSDKNYKYNLPIIQFVANQSSIFVEMEFAPEIRTSDNELNQNSISALIFIGVIALLFFKQDLMLELVSISWMFVTIQVQSVLDKKNQKETYTYDNTVNESEIEQLAQSINSVKKKKSNKI